jgi:hypothetical protein
VNGRRPCGGADVPDERQSGFVLRRCRCRGQALVETSVLLATLVGALAIGGLWLMRAHPEMMDAIDIAVRSYSFALSLPFP